MGVAGGERGGGLVGGYPRVASEKFSSCMCLYKERQFRVYTLNPESVFTKGYLWSKYGVPQNTTKIGLQEGCKSSFHYSSSSPYCCCCSSSKHVYAHMKPLTTS